MHSENPLYIARFGRNEKAENCPERFKKHPPNEDKKKEAKPIII